MAVRQLGDLARDAAVQPQEQGRRRDANARIHLSAAGGREGPQTTVRHAERPHHGRRVRGLGAGEHRAPAQDRGLERVRHRHLHGAVQDAGRIAVRRGLHAQRQGWIRRSDRARRGAQEAVMAVTAHKAPAASARHRRPLLRRGLSFEAKMLAPALLVLALVSIFPFVYIIAMSLSSVRMIGGISFDWVGLDNWTRLFGDGAVWSSWVRSIVFFVLSVGLEMFLGIAVALAIYETRRGRNIITSLVLMPMFMAPVIVGLLGRFMTDSTYGLYAWALDGIGLYNGDILGSKTSAFLAVTLMDVWEWTPLIALIVLAGLTSMPKQVLEAAAIDGASYWARLRDIVLPMIAGVIIVALLIRPMDAIRYCDIITNTTNGGPADATKIVPIRLYETAFRFFDLGYAAAIGLSMLAVTIIMANLFMRVLKQRGLAR